MRKSIVFVIALAASAVLAENASAVERPVDYIASAWLKQACRDNGGTFTSGGNHYGCHKACGDTKSDACSVECDSKAKTCKGYTPSHAAADFSIKQILSNGVAVQTVKPKGVPGSILGGSSGFATQNPSGAGSPMTPPKPVAPPPPQIR
jgi:hypothetical protein